VVVIHWGDRAVAFRLLVLIIQWSVLLAEQQGGPVVALHPWTS
jgi:hypothetical protein